MTQSTFWAEYFVRISDYPFLDAQTEKELGERIMKGSDQEKEDARNSLVLSHLRLAWSLAMEASIHWIDPEDLLQAGYAGFVDIDGKGRQKFLHPDHLLAFRNGFGIIRADMKDIFQ